ncbi:MAG TPA: glycosyltransferase [Chitinophagales bacterium]|nr:glycosyltransferase [Chitinophagales bacterium]
MKVLFAYNGRVEIDEHGRYYGNELNDRLVERYRYFGDQVTFIVRTRPIHAVAASELQPFESDLQVIPVPEMNTPFLFLRNRTVIHHKIKHAVNEHDVIIVREPGYVGRIAAQYARYFNKPYLTEVVGDPYDALSNHSTLGKIYAPIARRSMLKSIAKADPVLYVTKEYLQQRYPSTGYQLGLSDVVLKPSGEEVLESRIHKIGMRKHDDELVVGTAAALDVKYKGHEYVLQAMSILASQGIQLKYQVAGKGTGDRLVRLANDLGVRSQLDIIGQIPHGQVFDFLDNIDLYIQPSVTEGLPRALVEAMSRACPCLGSRVGGIPELLPDKYLFEKRNAKQLAGIIAGLSRHDLENMARQNAEAAKRFDPERSAESRLEFYDRFKRTYSSQ